MTKNVGNIGVCNEILNIVEFHGIVLVPFALDDNDVNFLCRWKWFAVDNATLRT